MIELEQAKTHLRVDHNAEDADIAIKLKIARAIVDDFIGASSPVTPQSEDIIDAATFLVLGELYVNRESGANPLSPSVKAMLERLRIPAFA